jgi:hypothetical protein
MGDALVNAQLPVPAVVKPMELWTGKQVFGMLIRPNAQTRCSCVSPSPLQVARQVLL